MKNIFSNIFFAAFLLSTSVLGQETFSFRASLDGLHAVPPNNSKRTSSFGEFQLDPSQLFSGGINLIDYVDVTKVSIFRSTSVTELGTRLYDFTPGIITLPGPGDLPGTVDPGFRRFDISQVLTTIETSDLKTGLWWVNVETTGFPNGEIRGQMTLIPEPGTFALVSFGAACILIHRKRVVPNAAFLCSWQREQPSGGSRQFRPISPN